MKISESMTRDAVTMSITVSTITARPGGGAFFTGQDASGKWIRVKADYDHISRLPVKGETWQLTGRFIYHQIYGNQLHVECCKQVSPTGSLTVRHLRTHSAFRNIGVGPKQIARLYKRFGDELASVIGSGDINVLTEVLTKETAERLLDKWRACASESSVVAFLDEHKVDVRLAGKILRYWGADAIEKLRENPYRLLIITNWDKADRVARKLGVEPLASIRLVAATEAWAYKCLDRHKDTLTDEKDLRAGIRQLTGQRDDAVTQMAIELAVKDNAIVGDSATGYQPLGCAVMERYIADRFRPMLPSVSRTQITLFGDSTENSLVDHYVQASEQKEGIRLNAEQRRAIHMAATCLLSVLKGGAGVGKTTVLKVIHQVVRAMRVEVFQIALAGRAAQRIREATGEEAYTIVGFLNRIQHGNLVPRPGDLVVIDESSMLDLMLTYRLMRALPVGVRLLFVGDPYQLPPIGPGLVFHVLADTPSVPATELTQIHRQAASTGIPQVAGEVRKGKIPNLAAYHGSSTGVSFIECGEYAIVRQLTNVIGDLCGFDETQILGVTKSGAAGVHNINQTFHNMMAPTKKRLPGWGMAESDPIIFTVNDYERELFNGSLGIIEKVFPHSTGSSGDEFTKAEANFDGRKIKLSGEDLGYVELAYAITIHKAQGSQFPRVIIPITQSRLLDRTLIYTALTRGIEQIIFVGDRRAFNDAVMRPPLAKLRKVGLSI